MFGKFKRTVLSFAAVVAVFGVYRLLAEPLIEPPRLEKRVAATAPEERLPVADHQHRLGRTNSCSLQDQWVDRGPG